MPLTRLRVTRGASPEVGSGLRWIDYMVSPYVRVTLGSLALLIWIIYVLQTSQFTSKGFHVPSPDKTMAARVMKVHRTPTFGSIQEYYEISLYPEYSPEKRRVRPLLKERHPLSIADETFTLTRDSIQWDMTNKTVTYHFGRTQIERGWQ